TAYEQPAGKTIPVRAGENLQSALNIAAPGDTITLEQGAVFKGPFVLPKKSGSAWIVVRSAAAGLPPSGTRVTRQHSAHMPKIVTVSPEPALRTASGAHHFRFIGIEFAVAASGIENYGVIWFGSKESALDQIPHDLIIDRCYVHGSATAEAWRGVLLHGA